MKIIIELPKTLVWSVVLLIAAMTATAQTVSRAQALEKAQTFMKDKGCTFDMERTNHRAQQVQPYYIFHADGGQGFVIVSGEESAPSIIGYSDVNPFDESNMPPALKAWLKDYADKVNYVQQNQLKFTRRAAENYGAAISNTTAKYDQDTPFNAQCPDVEVFADSKCTTPYTKNPNVQGKTQSVVGCMATALAIVMKYHGYPKATTAEIPARMNHVYETQDESDAKNPVTVWQRFSDPAIPAGTAIEWDKILDDYYQRNDDGSFKTDDNEKPLLTGTDEQKLAMAKMMRTVASAIGMQYGYPTLVGSSTNSTALLDGVKKYLNFPHAALHDEDDYVEDIEFRQALYNELKVAGAVLFSGQSNEGGHSFVIDGYTSDDIFSINWGWGGMCNGNYHLSSPNPENNGQKMEKDNGYSKYQEFFTGLYADAQTAIGEVKVVTPPSSDKAYDLQGRPVTGQYHGIMIRNGKKILNK